MNRGVLQSLIEKHFPAPDRKKLYSLLGIDLTAPSNSSSPRDSPCKENKTKKRKGEYFPLNGARNNINLSILIQAVFWVCTAFKRRLLLERNVMTNLDSILKSRHITLPTNVHLVKAMVFPVLWMDVRVGLQRKLSIKELMLLNCGVGEDS